MERMKTKSLKFFQKFFPASKNKIASYEEVLKAEWIFYINHISEGMTVFDVGAYIGDLTWVFSQFAGESGRVFAFEPSGPNFAKLKALCDLMELENIACEQLAVSDSSGLVDYFSYGKHYGEWGSLAQRNIDEIGGKLEYETKIEKVPSITLDEYCLKNNIENIDVLKIDVEGFELQVLHGAKRLFLEKRIGYCLFEFGGTTFEVGTSPRMITEFFEEVGYKIESIVKGAPLFPVNSKNMAQFNMIVAMPLRSE